MSSVGGSSSSSMVRKPSMRCGEGAPVVVEGALPLALLTQQVEVDVGDGGARPLGEALALGEQRAVLVDHRHAVPRQVGGALALSRSGIEVGGEAARRRAAGQQVAVLGARDGDGRAGDVGEDGRPGERRLVARWHGHPHVLAHLDVQRRSRARRWRGRAGRGRRAPGRRRPRSSGRAGRRRGRSGAARRTRGRSAGRTSAPPR